MKKIIFIVIPMAILFCSFGNTSSLSVEKLHRSSSLTTLTEQRLLDRVKTIKQFISTNSKYNNELAFFTNVGKEIDWLLPLKN